MRSLIALLALVAVASAQLSSDSLSRAKKGCDFGVPSDDDIGWVKVPCDETNADAKKVALGEGAEFLGSSFLTGSLGSETYAVHGKVDGKCCSQSVSRVAGTGHAHSFELSDADLCCHDSCPAWMKC